MSHNVVGSTNRHRQGRPVHTFLLILCLLTGLAGAWPSPATRAQDRDRVRFDEGIDAAQWYADHEIEHAWQPDYWELATGDPTLRTSHGIYAWPYALDSIGWNIQSYQDYGGTPYFHHGLDMMKVFGTQVFNRSGGQVVNIENYQPGNYLYWEVAVLDPDGYIWQYHHIDQYTIPQLIWDKFAEYQADPVNGGFIPADTHIGNIVEWPVWSFGKQFNHIHLNILAAGGVYVNGFEFHVTLPDTDGPEILGVGLLQGGQIHPGDEVEGPYSLYVHTRDLVLDDVYYLPPYEVTFSADGGPAHTTWRFDTLPGGADRYAYLHDFYVEPTCGDYSCREFYIDLGFVPDSHFEFPTGGGEHTVLVTVSDYAGNSASQAYTYTVIGPPAGTPVWQDDFETDLGWIRDPDGTDTATSGWWERGDPEDTYSDGPKQLGTTVSGVNDLVTGRLAGTGAGSYDVDGGVTSMRSPDIALPAAGELTLAFYYYLAHGSNSSAEDYLRLSVVGSTTTMVLEELGAGADDDAAWELAIVDLTPFAGQTVHLLVEAADDGLPSLVEAAIDDVLIVTPDLNLPPVADPQFLSTLEDTPLDILLTASDPEDDPLTYTVLLSPAHGTLTGTAPSLVYTPTADYFGPDSLTFVANDGHTNSEPAVVSIDVIPVNDAPVASPQSLSTAEDTPLDILLAASDPDGDLLTYTVTLTPGHGVLTGTAPVLTYIPADNYNGPDSLAFVVDDGHSTSAPAVVSIDVTAVNDAPVANTQSVATAEDTSLDITLTASDVDGDPLTYHLVLTPSHGALTGTPPALAYIPAADYYGSDSLAFVANDGQVDSAPAAVNIDITPVNDAPVADPQSVTARHAAPVAITLSGSDVDGDALAYQIVTQPQHGILSGSAPNLIYTPAPGFAGSDTFTFVVDDGELQSAVAEVRLTIVFAVYVPVVVK